MCKIAEELEMIGVEKGLRKGVESGISAMIQDNIETGFEKSVILEKIMRFFSLTRESALEYYDRVVI